MPANNKHMTVDGTIEVLNDLQTKADGRFAQGGGLVFSVNEESEISATYDGDAVDFPSDNGVESVTEIYTMSAANWDDNIYSFESVYPSSKWNITVSPCTTTTKEQLAAYNASQMVGSISGNTFTAFGTIPTIDIVVMIEAVSKKKERVALYTIAATEWDVNGVFSFESIYPSNQYNIIVSPCTTTTSEQLDAYNAAQMVGDANLNKLTCLGTIPEIDIVLMVTIFGNTVSGSKWASYERVLSVESWNNSTQSVTVEGINANTVGFVSLPTYATAEQKAAATKIHLLSQSANTVNFNADEEVTIDIPIVINIQG